MVLKDKLKESKEALNYLITDLLDLRDEVSLLIFADGDVEVAANFSNNKNEIPIFLDNRKREERKSA